MNKNSLIKLTLVFSVILGQAGLNSSTQAQTACTEDSECNPPVCPTFDCGIGTCTGSCINGFCEAQNYAGDWYVCGAESPVHVPHREHYRVPNQRAN